MVFLIIDVSAYLRQLVLAQRQETVALLPALQQLWNSGERAKALHLSKDLATFLARVYTHLFYSNMVAFAIALTFMRFSVTILGGDMTPFMGMVGRLV